MKIPQQIKLNAEGTELKLVYSENEIFKLSSEYLRVNSPSAEVRGHGQPILQIHEQNVFITNLEPIGNYSLKFTYSDGHNSGLYTWDYLYHLATNYDTIWGEYLALFVE